MTDVIACPSCGERVEVKKEEIRKEVQDPFDRGKTEPASNKELAARKEMFADQAKYDTLLYEMHHPKGNSTKEMEAYIRSKREDLESAKKKWNRSIAKHARLRAGRR